MLKLLINLLVALLVSLCVWIGPVSPAQAANPQSGALLSQEDLPPEFVKASDAETSSCRMAGDVAAFVVREPEPVELLCVSSFSLTDGAENPQQAEMIRQVFDAILKRPESFVEQAKAVDVEGIEILDNLAGIGEVATGFSKTETGIGRTEVVLFRRGDFFSSVLIRHQPDQKPVAPLETIARKIDQRLTAISNIPAQ